MIRRSILAWLATMLLALSAVTQPAASQEARRPPGRVVQINGFDLHYQEKGAGEPLLLLHGFGSCGDDWGPIAEALARDYRVIVPDLRGHGWSTNPANTFSMRRSAEDIAALLDRLAVRRVRAIGISAGGMTLLHLATREPERVEAMVLIGASTHFPEQARAIMRASAMETIQPGFLDFFRSCARRGEEQVRQLVGQFHAFKDSYEDMTFTPPTLGRIKARTLIVHGDRDPFFPVSIPVEMYRAIPGAELWIVPNGDHVPIYQARMGEFLRITRGFLAGARAPQTPR